MRNLTFFGLDFDIFRGLVNHEENCNVLYTDGMFFTVNKLKGFKNYMHTEH